MADTFTQEQVDAAVREGSAKAVQAAQAEWAKNQQTAIDKATADAKAAMEKEIGAKFKDYDTLKASHEQLGTVQQQLADLKKVQEENAAKVASSEETLKKTADALYGAVPETHRGLIHQSLSPADKINYILANGKLLNMQQIPNTPPKEPGTGGGGGGTGFGPSGQYSSLQEWAAKDQKTYLAARNAGTVK